MSDQRQKPREISKEAMLAHVKEMAEKNGIILRLEAPGLKNCKSYPHSNPMRVVTRPVTSQHTYFIALHELGHCLSPESKAASKEGKNLICEAEAWAWALKTARVDPNDETRAKLAGFLNSYNESWKQKEKQSRGNLQVVYPPSDSPYWTIIGWLKQPKERVRVLP